MNRAFAFGTLTALAVGPFLATGALGADAPMVLDDFEADKLVGWSAQPHSRIERVAGEETHSGRGALKWTFVADGKTRYGNLIIKSLPKWDLTGYDQIVFRFLSHDPVQGRIGFQLASHNKIVTLADVSRMATQGVWHEIRLDLGLRRLEDVTDFRLFCDGHAWQKGAHVFVLDDMRVEKFAVPVPPEKRDYGQRLGPAFSRLPADEQARRRRMAAPPPLAERRNPYSTPMYYLMAKGYGYTGNLDHKKRVYAKRAPKGEPGPDYGHWELDRNRPDWQEVMLRDWAELGLTFTHLNVYPSSPDMALGPDRRQALTDFRALSARHGLGIGVRMDFPFERHPETGAPAWGVHPKNPDSTLTSYLSWVRDVATVLRGVARYYVIGDEYNFHEKKPEEGGWNAELYMAAWTQVARTIRSVDPAVVLSMFGASSGNWQDVLDVLAHDAYRELAGAVAINQPTYQGVDRFFADVARLAPGLQLLSNGVGYCSSQDAQPRYPQHDPYAQYNDHDQGCAIAKNMFVWWDLGAAAAPYYITLRNWVLDGKVYPRWFGFFGVEDYVIDAQKNLSVKRYPAWHAFQTITHTFHDRPSFSKPGFAVASSKDLSHVHAFVRAGRELVLILWQDFHQTVYTDVRIASPRFRHPVRVSLFDKTEWGDVVYTVAPDGMVALRDLPVGFEPAVVRLFAD